MKKGNSFFVKMDPPKKRSKLYTEAEKKSKPEKHDESYVQSVSWQELIDADINSVKAVDKKPEEAVSSAPVIEHKRAPVEEIEYEYEPKSGRRERKVVISPSFRKTFLLIRLAAASIMFAAAVLSNGASFRSELFFIAAAVIAGFDIINDAVFSIIAGDILNSSVIILVVDIVAFVLRYYTEGAAVIILYQVGLRLIDILMDYTSEQAVSLIDSRDKLTLDIVNHQLEFDGTDYLKSSQILRRSITLILSIGIFLAIAFAIIVPLVSYYQFRAAIHRALCVILLCTPLSILASSEAVALFAYCASAAEGVIFQSALTLEELSNSKLLIIDKSGIFDKRKPEIVLSHSDALDEKVFNNLLYHILYNSKSNVAEAFLEKHLFDYDENIVSDFTEYPDGITAVINKMPILFGRRSFIENHGCKVGDLSFEEAGICYYLYVSGKYGGIVVISSDEANNISQVLFKLRSLGINKIVLVTDETPSKVQDIAEINGFDEVYADISSDNKKDVITELSQSFRYRSLVLTSDEDLTAESYQTLILVGDNIDYADAAIVNQRLSGLPLAFNLSSKISKTVFSNAIISFIIKAILIFLSLTGSINLWMAIAGDIIGALITIAISKRIIDKPMFNTLFSKYN